MVGDKKKILNGSKYNKYFKPPQNKVKQIGRAKVMQTLEIMEEIVLSTLDQTKDIAKVLKHNDTYTTAKEIWNFAHHYIQYKNDESGKEQLREPNRSWADRKTGIDCDCFSIFVSSILMNLGIEHSFRITKYNGNDYFQHVYVVIKSNGREIIIDPVVNHFDYEKKYTGKHDKKMSIRHEILSGVNGAKFGFEFDGILNGLGSVSSNEILSSLKAHLENTREIVQKDPETVASVVNPQTYLNQLNYVLSKDWNNTAEVYQAIELVESQTESLGRLRDRLSNGWNKVKKGVKKATEKVKTGVKKAVKAVVKYNPLTLAMRGGLLLAFKINLFHFTEKLKYGYLTESQAKQNGLNISNYRRIKDILGKVEQMFEKVGGDKENLKKAILTGRKGSLSDLNLSPEATKPTPTITTNSVKQKVNIASRFNPSDIKSFAPQMSEIRLSGLGAEPVTTATTTAAASGLLATIGSWLSKIDWKNVFDKAGQAQKAVQSVKTTIDTARNTINNSGNSAPVSTGINPYANNGNIPTVTLPTHTVNASKTNNTNSNSGGMSTGNKTALLVGTTVLALGLSYMAFRPKKQLAGIPEVSI